MKRRKNARIASRTASIAILFALVFGDGLAGSASAAFADPGGRGTVPDLHLRTPQEAPTASDRPRPTVEVIGMSTTERDAVQHSIELFAEAGLELPALSIERHDNTQACNGHDGLHHMVGARSQIDICVGGSWEDHVILHELTHAWAFHYLTPERKEAFQQLRGWKYWLDYGQAEWQDNGAEQAAEIMVWALSDRPTIVVKLDHNSCTELRAGYITLTGLEPLHGYTDRCDDGPVVRRS